MSLWKQLIIASDSSIHQPLTHWIWVYTSQFSDLYAGILVKIVMLEIEHECTRLYYNEIECHRVGF